MNVAATSWRELTADELSLLATMGRQLGAALERFRLADERARLARLEERARLAREIHDTLAQGLTGIALQIEGAIAQLRKNPELAEDRLQRALELTRENLEEARRSVLDLRAGALDGKPLPEALRALGRSFTAETGVRVRLDIAASVPRELPSRIEGELYRIAQEALTNLARHSAASEARISLDLRGGALRLKIRDNGSGFPSSGDEGGYGVSGMRERARLLGGRLRVNMRLGYGTTVTAEVPLPEAP
jgi:two-component system NarL family sensor kinase